LDAWARRKKPIGKNRYLKNECPLCDKHFKTEDFLQFHMKTSHEPGESLLKEEVGNTCLSQLFCDIFPCGDLYYELSGVTKVIVDSNQADLARLKLSSFTGKNETDRTYARCSKVILDCVDWADVELDFSNVTHAYDLLHALYCDKGLPHTEIKKLRKFVQEGKVVRKELQAAPKKEKRKSILEDEVLFWFVIILGMAGLVLYYLVVYCLIYENID